MKVPVYNSAGENTQEVEISDAIFQVPLKTAVVHQALLRQLADARSGNADTKTRGEVEGSTKKLYAQKHTGRARRGNVRSPIMRHGGIAFGPHPRSYEQKLPKKMGRLALKGLLSSKAADGELKVVEKLGMNEIKTKIAVKMLVDLGIDDTALVLTDGVDLNLKLSARNIPGVRVMDASVINVVDLMNHKYLVAEMAAIKKIERIWGPKEPAVQGSKQ